MPHSASIQMQLVQSLFLIGRVADAGRHEPERRADRDPEAEGDGRLAAVETADERHIKRMGDDADEEDYDEYEDEDEDDEDDDLDEE